MKNKMNVNVRVMDARTTVFTIVVFVSWIASMQYSNGSSAEIQPVIADDYDVRIKVLQNYIDAKRETAP